MTTITIHRGTRQIGGCVTEIRTGNDRVFIDFGENLNEGDAANMQLDGLTTGGCSKSALFLTHYHGDHIGRLREVNKDVLIYMGETAKAIQLKYIERTNKSSLPLFERIITYKAAKSIKIGNISVTPLMIDHSAFDAYMFIIEAEGKRILYTGDFRFHGVRGGKTPGVLEKYAKDINYIICEGTTLSRDETGKKLWSEFELKRKAKDYMKNNKYVFVLCSSTHIDRIGIFYNVRPKERLFICDEYQKEILDIVQRKHAGKSSFYNFKDAKSYGKNLDNDMKEKGFCMLTRQGMYQDILKDYKDDSLLIYSMSMCYLEGPAMNQKLVDYITPFRKRRHFRVLHTSGHASPKDIMKLYETVNPKIGLIPIHTDAPEMFNNFVPDGKLKLLEDGEVFQI